MAKIKIDKVNKFYGNTQVIKDISLEISDASFTVFVVSEELPSSSISRQVATTMAASIGLGRSPIVIRAFKTSCIRGSFPRSGRSFLTDCQSSFVTSLSRALSVTTVIYIYDYLK